MCGITHSRFSSPPDPLTRESEFSILYFQYSALICYQPTDIGAARLAIDGKMQLRAVCRRITQVHL
jgi:hypothetical protein